MSSSGGGDSLSEQHLSVDMCAQDVSSKIGVVVEREGVDLLGLYYYSRSAQLVAAACSCCLSMLLFD